MGDGPEGNQWARTARANGERRRERRLPEKRSRWQTGNEGTRLRGDDDRPGCWWTRRFVWQGRGGEVRVPRADGDWSSVGCEMHREARQVCPNSASTVHRLDILGTL